MGENGPSQEELTPLEFGEEDGKPITIDRAMELCSIFAEAVEDKQREGETILMDALREAIAADMPDLWSWLWPRIRRAQTILTQWGDKMDELAQGGSDSSAGLLRARHPKLAKQADLAKQFRDAFLDAWDKRRDGQEIWEQLAEGRALKIGRSARRLLREEIAQATKLISRRAQTRAERERAEQWQERASQEGRIADKLRAQLAAHHAENLLQRHGDWQICYAGEYLGSLGDCVGLRYIHILLRHRDERIGYEDLKAERQWIGKTSKREPPENDRDDEGQDAPKYARGQRPTRRNPAMDWEGVRSAKDERDRLLKLAESAADPSEKAEYTEEAENIEKQIKDATRPGGRDGKGELRELDPTATNLSASVRKAIREAISKIASQGPEGWRSLAKHLKAFIDYPRDGTAIYSGDTNWVT